MPAKRRGGAAAAVAEAEAEEEDGSVLAASQASAASAAAGFIPPSQQVRPHKKLLDQKQTLQERKAVTARINELSNEIHKNRAELTADRDFAFQKSVSRVAVVHDQVLHTSEAIRSLGLISQLSDILLTGVKHQFQSSKTHGLWVCACVVSEA